MLLPCPLYSVVHYVPERNRNLPTHFSTKASSGTSCRRGKSHSLNWHSRPCIWSSPLCSLIAYYPSLPGHTEHLTGHLHCLNYPPSSHLPCSPGGLLLNLQSPAKESLLPPRGLRTSPRRSHSLFFLHCISPVEGSPESYFLFLLSDALTRLSILRARIVVSSSPQKAGNKSCKATKIPPSKDVSPALLTPLSLPTKDPMIPNSTREHVNLTFHNPNLSGL